jgi:hypothetical protein
MMQRSYKAGDKKGQQYPFMARGISGQNAKAARKKKPPANQRFCRVD